MFYRFLILTFTFALAYSAQGQEKVFQTFKDTRVINSHSTETLRQGQLDLRISHRFGDFAGDVGGWQNFYGLENAADISTGLDFGVTNNLMIGVHRAKGAGPLRQNLNGYVKYKIAAQEVDGNKPFSLAVVGLASYTTMRSSPTAGVLNFFDKSSYRLSYHSAVLMAKKFGQRFSMQLSGGWTYRNIVAEQDKNDLVNLGAAAKLQLTKSFGILFDGAYVFSEFRTAENDFYQPFGFGLEWDTGGGHIFQINFTNSEGLAETDYLPYTSANWADGEFRLGFTISRLFNVR